MFCFCDILYFVVDLVYFLIERLTVGCMVCLDELREVKGYDKIYCMRDLRKIMQQKQFQGEIVYLVLNFKLQSTMSKKSQSSELERSGPMLCDMKNMDTYFCSDSLAIYRV